MLRSILAIWTVALTLVAVAALSGCGGCLDGDRGCGSFGSGSSPDMTTLPDLADVCPQSCSVCAADQICFQGSFAAQLPSFCAHGCADDRDCGAGQTCASLFAALQPSVCIGAGLPIGCGGKSPDWHCHLQGPTCKDASTLSRPFSHASDQVCGWELVHCANGCMNGACL